MSVITVNGTRVATASITIPYYGAWSADVTMPSGATIASPVTIVAGDLTLTGTVTRQASFAGDVSARIVAGGAGWRNELPAKGYSHLIGVKLSSLLTDVANECGERISIDTDRTVGNHWARERASGERTLRLLLDGLWWVDGEGVTQTGPRPSSAVATPFTLVSRSPARGSLEVATESLAGWLPGNTFTCNTVADPQTISSVTVEAGNDGKVRLHVLSTDGATERLRTDIRNIVRAELASFSYGKTWAYTIAADPLSLGLVSTVDCTPVDPSMPALTKVPLVGTGVVAAPVAGTSCRVRFVDGDPSRPEVIALGGTTEHLMTAEATALLIYNTFAALALVSPGPMIGLATAIAMPAAIVAAIAAQSVPAPPGLVAQLAAAALQASNFTSGLVASTSAPFSAAVSTAIEAKILNVSGLFPGVGVPNQ